MFFGSFSRKLSHTVALHLGVLVLAFVAFILLAITTFSVPIGSSLYFLHSSQANGVRFGIWGWCLDEDGTCMSPMQLGYTWEPQIAAPITSALILYPIATTATFLTMISLVPVICVRTIKTDRVFRLFSVVSFVFSAFAFIFMIAIWGVAKKKFERAGFTAQYGPLPWASLFATLLLSVVAIASFKIGPSDSQLVQVIKEKESRFTQQRPRRRSRPRA